MEIPKTYGMKTLAKLASGFLWNKAGLMRAYLRLCKELGDCPCLVLAYHRVLPRPQIQLEETEPSLVVSTETFEEQLLFLKKYFGILTMDQMVDTLNTGSSFPTPSCVLTFDDGWRDTYLHAYPILKRLSVPATVFVATRHVDSGEEFWFDTLYRMFASFDPSTDLAREVVRSFFPKIPIPSAENRSDILKYARMIVASMKDFPIDKIDEIMEHLMATKVFPLQRERKRSVCSWAELKEMISTGLVTVGSHTVSHAILTRENTERCRRELTESKKALEEHLEVPVEHFCYPNGNYNSDTEDLVRKAGYKSALPGLYGVTTRGDSPFAVRRTAFSESSSGLAENGFSQALFSYQLLSCFLRREVVAGS